LEVGHGILPFRQASAPLANLLDEVIELLLGWRQGDFLFGVVNTDGAQVWLGHGVGD
jgi:hypothetical protein